MASRQQQQDLAYWYVDFTTNLLRLAEEYFVECRYPETIDSAQDAIEFSLKAIFEFAGQQYPRARARADMLKADDIESNLVR